MELAFWKRKKASDPVTPAGAELHDSTRPGVGSDPAPYVADNERGTFSFTPGHEPLPMQWARLGRGRSADFDNGVPFADEMARTRHDTKVLYGVAPDDDGHVESRFVGDPYEKGAPPVQRRCFVGTTFRQLAESVQHFGGYGDTMNGTHFSMADNVRTYPIGGMQSVVSRRNTYRLAPPPLDINSAVMPPSAEKFDVPERVSVSGLDIGLRTYRSML